MSMQPQPPRGGPPPPPGMYPPAPYGAPPVSPPAATRPKGGVILGVVVLVLGLAAGAALYLGSGATREQTIERFARAPVGCTTTLQFDRAGTFTVYIELTGTIAAVGGDCDRSGESYRWTGATLPAYTLTMVDADGASVALAESTGSSYDTGTWRGQAVSRVQVGAPGAYRLTVDSADTGYAVAIGGDPDADASRMQVAGIASAVGGLLVGVLLIVLGRRRRRPGTPAGMPVASVPSSAPAPPYVPGPGAAVPPLAERPRLPTHPPGAAPPPPPGWGAPRP